MPIALIRNEYFRVVRNNSCLFINSFNPFNPSLCSWPFCWHNRMTKNAVLPLVFLDSPLTYFAIVHRQNCQPCRLF